MRTERTPVQIEFEGLGRCRVPRAFDGDRDGGVVSLREVDARLGITEKLAETLEDNREKKRPGR